MHHFITLALWIMTSPINLAETGPGRTICCCAPLPFEYAIEKAAIIATVEVIEPVGTDYVIVWFNEVWKCTAPYTTLAQIKTDHSGTCSYDEILQPNAGTRYINYFEHIPEDTPLEIIHHDCVTGGLYEQHLDHIEQLKRYRNDAHSPLPNHTQEIIQ